METRRIAERVWPGRDPHVEELGGGITNRNFKVTVDGNAYVLRIAGKDTELLGIDRDAERAATLAAAAAGVAPEVVAFVEPEGYLVTRFIDGRPLPPDEMRRPENIAEAAATLRRIHEGAPIPGRFDSFRVVEDYRETAERHGVRVPREYAWAHRIAEQIEARRGSRLDWPCHNDLLNANFLVEKDRLRIVDWEYAGMGDRFFDLANFSINHEFGEAENEALLRAYFGNVGGEDLNALRLMRFMSDFREAMWGVVQQGISELDFDFVGYADEHFRRLEQTAGEAAFERSLA